jgi:hypothetical protein
MLLWFLGGAWVLVWAVLQDPAVDYRLVMLGALLPDLVDALLGGTRFAHTLVASVGLLTVVMLATIGHRSVRRRLLGLPIGTLVHLVLDAVWTDARVFWWPAKGWSLAHAGALPSLRHPAAVTVVEELCGAGALAWCWARFRLREPARRTVFVRTGRVGRDLGPRGGTAGLPSPRRP